MIDPELQQRFRELLTRCDESHLEYEEEHGDAGDAYSHCVVEDSHNVREALVYYILTNFPGWTPEEVKAVLGEFDQWSFDMVPGHRFSGRRNTDPDESKAGCQVWSTSVEEVENQVEVKTLAESLDCEVENIRELVLAEKEGRMSDFCIGHIYRPETFTTFETYQATDACWFAVVPYDWFTEKIEEVREHAEEVKD
jgi:hypothetical protein